MRLFRISTLSLLHPKVEAKIYILRFILSNFKKIKLKILIKKPVDLSLLPTNKDNIPHSLSYKMKVINILKVISNLETIKAQKWTMYRV